VEVVRGSVMLEVDNKLKEAKVSVLERDASASILKEGLYRFDSDQGRISVFDGKLQVSEDGQSKEFGKGKEIVLNSGSNLKPVSFDRKAKDDLYVWSDVRSKYLADANASSAQYVYSGLGGYRGDGWFWNPYFSTWSWLPGNGLFYSPFGYPFYSLGYAPFYGGWYGGRTYYRPGIVGARPPVRVMPRALGGGFRGGGGSIGGGGFHGGGFHGGGGRR
jgi:dipeptidyl aminopeptidase/acylaminoacyl peptidase